MKELPKIIFNDEDTKIKNSIDFEIKSDLVGQNDSNKHIVNPLDRGKIKRINDVSIDKIELEKAPKPPELPIPKMPSRAKRPPELPRPIKMTFRMRLRMFRSDASNTGKQITKTMSKINYFFVFGIVLLCLGLIIFFMGIYGKSNLEKKYNELITNFNEINYIDLKQFCFNRKYKDCSKYNTYINGLETFNNKKYNEALDIFNSISDFKLSTNYIDYIYGLEYMEKYDLFRALTNFKNANILNSNDYVKYIELINQINNNETIDYSNAYELENSIGLNYISNYNDSKKLFADKNYKRVIDLLDETSNVITVSKDILYEAKYLYSKELQYNGYIGSAYKYLNEIKGYKDSSSILNKPIYTIINNWIYNDNGFVLKLSFYESSDTCFNEMKNGSLIGLPYDEDSTIYEYIVKNNAIYFKDSNNEYKAIYIIKSFSKEKLTILFEDKIMELIPRT